MELPHLHWSHRNCRLRHRTPRRHVLLFHHRHVRLVDISHVGHVRDPVHVDVLHHHPRSRLNIRDIHLVHIRGAAPVPRPERLARSQRNPRRSPWISAAHKRHLRRSPHRRRLPRPWHPRPPSIPVHP